MRREPPGDRELPLATLFGYISQFARPRGFCLASACDFFSTHYIAASDAAAHASPSVSWMLQGSLVAAAVFLGCIALGHALEELANRQIAFLHLVPLGPGEGADPVAYQARPSPYGEHGWIPIPMGLVDMGLLVWDGADAWLHSGPSFWGRCNGPVWGQLPMLAMCSFGILPTVLAAWLLWMPVDCEALPLALSALAGISAVISLLFWADWLPIVPTARATEAAARAGIRRSWLCLAHVAYYLLYVSTDTCSAAIARAVDDTPTFVTALDSEMQSHTPQGAMKPSSLVLQVLVAVGALHLIMDRPRGGGRHFPEPLWGPGD